MKRYTVNHYPVKTVKATLLHKRISPCYRNPVLSTEPELVYELTFQTEQGLQDFEIDAFGYQTIPDGATDILTYQGYELLSFGSWYPVKHKE